MWLTALSAVDGVYCYATLKGSPQSLVFIHRHLRNPTTDEFVWSKPLLRSDRSLVGGVIEKTILSGTIEL